MVRFIGQKAVNGNILYKTFGYNYLYSQCMCKSENIVVSVYKPAVMKGCRMAW